MKSKRNKILLLLSRIMPLLFVVIGVGCTKNSTSSYDHLRERYFDVLTSSQSDITDSIVEKRIKEMDISVETLWKNMDKSPEREYLWETDKKVENPSGVIPHGSISSKVTGSFGKLNQLALAYRTKGSLYENNAQLKKDILEGIDWMLANKYNPSVKWYDNWWDWVIEIGRAHV